MIQCVDCARPMVGPDRCLDGNLSVAEGQSRDAFVGASTPDRLSEDICDLGERIRTRRIACANR